MAKIQITTRNSFDIIKSAVDKTVDLIKPTYGPAANKVIISKVTHGMVVDDGVQIARDLELPDANENAVLKVIRETAIRTNDRVGDGTTSSLIMLQAIVDQVSKKQRWHGHKIAAELKTAVVEVKDQLTKQSKPVTTKEDLMKIARVSFDDPVISEIIADTWHKVGKDGVITIEGSVTANTTVEMADGLSFNRGYMSPYMVTNPQRMESVIEKPYILLTDYRLTESGDILPIMNMLAGKQILNLVIIADNVEQSALATIVLNKMQGKFNVLAISIPPADDKSVLLEDIALLIGAKVFSMNNGNKLIDANGNSTVKFEDLGRAERFTAKEESSIILKPRGKKVDIGKAITDLRIAIDENPDEKKKKILATRLALFTNQVAVIKVGGATENEQRALRYKVEDAINAVRSAYRGGVVCGAGLSLARLKTSSPILNEALKYPFKQLMENMGIEDVPELKNGEALNVVTMKSGKYLEVGVIDPVDVLIAGVESAVSIASLLITTSGMIVEPPQQIRQG